MTNAEYVRSLSDRQIGTLIAHLADGGTYPSMCKNLPECVAALDQLDQLPHSCEECELAWAQAEYTGWSWICLEAADG